MKKLINKDFLNYNYLSNVNTSPNGQLFTFVKAKANYDDNKYDHQLYVSDGLSHRLVMNLKESPYHIWYNDTSILRSNVNDNKTKVEIIDINTKEVLKTTEIPFPVSSLKKISDSQFIVSASLQPDFFDDDFSEHDYDLHEVIETIPFYSNGGTFTRGKTNQIFIYDLETGDFEQISSFDEIVSNYRFVKKENIIYFTSIPNTGITTFYDSVYIYDLNTGQRKDVYTEKEYSIADLIPLNNKLYVFASTLKEHGINQNNDFYLLEDGDLKQVAEFSLSAWNSIGSDVRLGGGTSRRIHHNKFYFVGTYHKTNRLYVFDGETVEIVIEPEGSIDHWEFYKDTILAVHLDSTRLQELAFINEANQIELISNFNHSNLENYYVAKPEYIEFENDGQKLDGWILFPKDYEEGNTYPAILDIHGGPKTIYSDVFYHEMQVWANDGYFVFFANPRGGDVYGNDFADIRGKYGTIDYDDLMAFTDLVLSKYPIDPSRVGVTGGSYGGFMTNWIVSHTNRFAAAATQRSISNWISFYGTSDIGYYFASDQTDANPYEKHEQMWEQSPLKHAQNIETPLLFIHAEQDYRCPVEQAMQLYTIVKEKGVETRFIWFKNENHDLSRTGSPKNRLTRLEEIQNWMNKHIK
ncbi:S9 family peptidase [Erysipelothrix urinaevulpis]|uniref:S9 family peptidase n=1 Tax=Erysipelothrix urinaevulpis TaxID=2683717 RepID=UPI00135C2A9C|nr:S9 family peptidase [Erysipelothrix urinaevulpis]